MYPDLSNSWFSAVDVAETTLNPIVPPVVTAFLSSTTIVALTAPSTTL